MRQDCIISPVLVRAELGACYQRRTNRAEARVRGRQRGSDQRIGSFLIHVARIEAGLHGAGIQPPAPDFFPEFQPTTKAETQQEGDPLRETAQLPCVPILP